MMRLYLEPTYEELKHLHCIENALGAHLFRAYLRGIETRMSDLRSLLPFSDLEPTYEELKQDKYKIVNNPTAYLEPTYEELKRGLRPRDKSGVRSI